MLKLYGQYRSRAFRVLAKFPKLQAWLAASIERPGAKQARKLRE